MSYEQNMVEINNFIIIDLSTNIYEIGIGTGIILITSLKMTLKPNN